MRNLLAAAMLALLPMTAAAQSTDGGDDNTAAAQGNPVAELRRGNGSWKPNWYWKPIYNAQGMTGRSGAFIQARAGAEVGATYHSNLRSKPILVGRTRLRGIGLYGIPTNSFGADARLGSFIGPQIGKYIILQHGPDFWFNFYGTSTSPDYFLQPTPGLTIRNQMLIQPLPEIGFMFQANPGWVFREARHPPDNYLGVFHEVDLIAAVILQTPATGPLTIGYQRTYDGFGMRQGILFQSNFN